MNDPGLRILALGSIYGTAQKHLAFLLACLPTIKIPNQDPVLNRDGCALVV